MNFPENLRYTKEHEWIVIDEDASTDDKKIALIGITDFAQGELGELVYVEVETIGETIEQDEIFGTVEAVKTTSDLFMPVTGKVLELNPALDENEGDNPALINEDPYGAGWLIKIEVSNPEDIETLMDAAAYEALVA